MMENEDSDNGKWWFCGDQVRRCRSEVVVSTSCEAGQYKTVLKKRPFQSKLALAADFGSGSARLAIRKFLVLTGGGGGDDGGYCSSTHKLVHTLQRIHVSTAAGEAPVKIHVSKETQSPPLDLGGQRIVPDDLVI